MSTWPQLARETLLDNSLTQWLFAALAFVLTFTVLPLLRGYLRAQSRRHRDRELPAAIALVAYLIDRTSRVVLWIAALYAAEQILLLPVRIDHLFDVVIKIGLWWQTAIWATAAARFGLQRHQARTGDTRLAGTMDIVLFVVRLIIWVVVALMALGSLGINVGPLVAGLGVGGIALALAVQTVLSDLFASLSIALDKPFVVGDTLRVDTFEGVVEQIGIKSTRLRSITGEQIIIGNADLLKSRVRNLKRATEWRALFKLSLAYDTPTERLDAVVPIVSAAVASYPGARFGYCLLTELGESALRYEACFYLENAVGRDMNRALDQVNRQILRGFTRAGIQFAYPTRTLWLRGARSLGRERQEQPEQEVQQDADAEVKSGQAKDHAPGPGG
jgi:small-conductance mechanosensitive channel